MRNYCYHSIQKNGKNFKLILFLSYVSYNLILLCLYIDATNCINFYFSSKNLHTRRKFLFKRNKCSINYCFFFFN